MNFLQGVLLCFKHVKFQLQLTADRKRLTLLSALLACLMVILMQTSLGDGSSNEAPFFEFFEYDLFSLLGEAASLLPLLPSQSPSFSYHNLHLSACCQHHPHLNPHHSLCCCHRPCLSPLHSPSFSFQFLQLSSFPSQSQLSIIPLLCVNGMQAKCTVKCSVESHLLMSFYTNVRY